MAQPTVVSGTKLLILVGDGGSPETFAAPCGITTSGIGFAAASQTTVLANCADPDSAPWEIKDITSLSAEVSGAGVMAVESFDVWNDWFQAADIRNVQIKLNDVGYWSGSFGLSSLKYAGQRGQKVTLDVTLINSGPVTWTTGTLLLPTGHAAGIGAAAAVSVVFLPNTIFANCGVFTLTGDPMQPSVAYTMSLAVGSFALIGQSATLIAPSSYSAEALAVFAAMTTPPDSTRKGLIDACIVGLKSDGVWALLDMLQVYAAADSQAAGVDWRNTARTITFSGSPVFTADRGFQTDGTTNYMDTGYNPFTGPNFVQDSACWGIWSRTDVSITSGGSGWFDGTDGIVINPRNNTNNHAYRINHATPTSVGATVNGSGLHVANRSASNVTGYYRNGAIVGSAGSAASVAVNNHTLLVGAIQAATPSQNRQWAAAFAAASLDATKQTAIYNRLQTYMTAVGA